eukprot:359289-Chlamydomonas_euryale.AAC.3
MPARARAQVEVKAMTARALGDGCHACTLGVAAGAASLSRGGGARAGDAAAGGAHAKPEDWAPVKTAPLEHWAYAGCTELTGKGMKFALHNRQCHVSGRLG